MSLTAFTCGLVADVDHQAGGLADGVQRQDRLVRKEQAAHVEDLEGQLRHEFPAVLPSSRGPHLALKTGWPQPKRAVLKLLQRIGTGEVILGPAPLKSAEEHISKPQVSNLCAGRLEQQWVAQRGSSDSLGAARDDCPHPGRADWLSDEQGSLAAQLPSELRCRVTVRG